VVGNIGDPFPEDYELTHIEVTMMGIIIFAGLTRHHYFIGSIKSLLMITQSIVRKCIEVLLGSSGLTL